LRQPTPRVQLAVCLLWCLLRVCTGRQCFLQMILRQRDCFSAMFRQAAWSAVAGFQGVLSRGNIQSLLIMSRSIRRQEGIAMQICTSTATTASFSPNTECAKEVCPRTSPCTPPEGMNARVPCHSVTTCIVPCTSTSICAENTLLKT